MIDHAEPTGEPGAIAQTADVDGARMVGQQLADADGVRGVALHTDDTGGWALLRATGDPAVVADACRSVPGASTAAIRSRRLRRHRVRWPAGDPTPGVSMVFDVRRSSDLSIDEFHRHWRDVHGPKALAHHLGMWDYDQLSVVDGDLALHGIAVVSFPSAEDARDRFFDTDLGADIIRADASSFTDSQTLGRRLTTEWVLRDDPGPASVDGVHQDWADHRSLELPVSPDEAWDVVGDFGALLDWWPGGLVTISVEPGPPVSRTLGRPDGSSVTEALVHHRPDERMFQLAVTAGFPDGVDDYTCRYEIRATGEGCRLDWSPRASVAVGAEPIFGSIVDGGWSQIEQGLRSHLAA